LSERRQRFQLEIADRLRGLSEPGQIIETASALIGRHLGLTRVMYAQIAEDGRELRIDSDWHDGNVPGIQGQTYPVAQFGAALAENMQRGGPFWVTDVETDSRTATHAAVYASAA